MKDIVNLYKYKGETPLQALNRLKAAQPDLQKEPLSYAGRLDPMAEGVLIVLVGDANQEREKYLGLEKKYEVEILFGVETDTYDVLGIVNASHPRHASHVHPLSIREGVGGVKYLGKFDQPYPPYSSQPVHGKPLFQWAREGRLSEITIPTKKVEIFSLDVLEERQVSSEELVDYVNASINLVKGDFRQEEIKKSWQTLPKNTEFSVVKIKVSCSSGVYMRSLAHRIGKDMNSSSIALSITRTKAGDFTINDSLRC